MHNIQHTAAEGSMIKKCAEIEKEEEKCRGGKKWSGESCLAGVALQGATANQIRWAECNLSFTLRPRIPRNCATLKSQN